MALDEKKFYMVIQDLLSGKSAIEIAAYRHIERKTITGYLKKLQNPESKYYNLEQYESILFIREVKSGTFIDKDLLNEIIDLYLSVVITLKYIMNQNIFYDIY